MHVWSPERMAYISLSALQVKSTLPVVKNFHYWLDKKLHWLRRSVSGTALSPIGLRLGTDKNDSNEDFIIFT